MNTDLPDLDLRAVEVFRLVASTGSFTRAGREIGLTQSAVTRQIQQLESEIGAALFHRTTRRVSLTEPGRGFYELSTQFLRNLEQGLESFREDYLNKPPSIRLGLSNSIPHSHLPGFLSYFRRTVPRARVSVAYDSASRIRHELSEHNLDVGIFTRPETPPLGLTLNHSFRDDFTVIAPPGTEYCHSNPETHNWILIDQGTTARERLKKWMTDSQIDIVPAMELNNFDSIVNLVSLGLGISAVPRRALRLYGHRRNVNEIEPEIPVFREIGVYSRKSPALTLIVRKFIENILFDWKSPGARNLPPDSTDAEGTAS